MKRRKQNRKKNSGGFFFPAPLALVLFLVTSGVIALIWMSTRCEVTGERIQALERQKVELRQRMLNEEFKWTNTRTLPNVQAALRKHGLRMDWPTSDRVVVLTRRALPERPVGAAYVEYAQYGGGEPK